MIDASLYPHLSRIYLPGDLRNCNVGELKTVAEELRKYVIESVGRSGGHFAAGLGVIELTIALHYLYNTPHDLLVWDVGHQTYPHKILTGRAHQIHTVKQYKGLMPFPAREESIYDSFGVGHSSTSISAALGMAIAAQNNSQKKVVAIIGDGAMTAGMAYEALNHAGGMRPEPNLLVILNDNRMSISEAVGGLKKILGRATGSRTLNALREGGKRILGDTDKPAARFLKRWEEHWKGMFVPSTLFEEMGFHYTGPIDGHDIPALLKALSTLRTLKGTQLLHVVTTKGKGYEPAEDDQIRYHAVGPFDPDKGLPSTPPIQNATSIYTDVFSQWLLDMAQSDSRLRAITPAMREGSGLVAFSKQFPERYFDVAIAEQHAVTLAAGMATQGLKPVVAIYSTFLQRAYDQVIHDVALQNLDVVFAIDRAGVVGPDGPTHAGSFDISFLRCIPNLLLMAPANESECRQMLSTGFSYPGPAAIRYPRISGTPAQPLSGLETLPIGKAQLLFQGSGLAILAFGTPVHNAEIVGRELGFTVVNMRFIKPLDAGMLLHIAATHKGIVTIEEGSCIGGAGSGVSELLNAEGITLPMLQLGLPDLFLSHGSRNEVLQEAKLDIDSIRARILRRWPEYSQRLLGQSTHVDARVSTS